MIRTMINGFCMALADSVPGVSGGTIALILGFYDKFIGSINQVFYGKKEEKKEGLIYLIKLLLGWAVGMILAVLVLTKFFETNIYAVSSLFLGFIFPSIFIIAKEEYACIQKKWQYTPFVILGIAIVAALTYMNSKVQVVDVDLTGAVFVPGRRGCHYRNVPARHFRLHRAADLRRVSAGDQWGQRAVASALWGAAHDHRLWRGRYLRRAGIR